MQPIGPVSFLCHGYPASLLEVLRGQTQVRVLKPGQFSYTLTIHVRSNLDQV